MSGIFAGLMQPRQGDLLWRLWFVGGLFAGGVALAVFAPDTLSEPSGRPLAWVALAGLLVGFGTRMGNGCTSGHGVCGLSRFSPRSLVAVLTFMTTGFLAATAASVIGGGS